MCDPLSAAHANLINSEERSWAAERPGPRLTECHFSLQKWVGREGALKVSGKGREREKEGEGMRAGPWEGPPVLSD